MRALDSKSSRASNSVRRCARSSTRKHAAGSILHVASSCDGLRMSDGLPAGPGLDRMVGTNFWPFDAALDGTAVMRKLGQVDDRQTKWNEASQMSEVTLTPVEPTPHEVQYLEDRIYEFNSSATEIADGELLAFFVHERDRIVAGICGNTWGGTCELRQFWVEEAQRRRGLGTKLFQAAEREARRRGCTQIVLMTFSFQAPAFYERRGFEVVATIDDHPRGHRNLLLRKRLDS